MHHNLVDSPKTLEYFLIQCCGQESDFLCGSAPNERAIKRALSRFGLLAINVNALNWVGCVCEGPSSLSCVCPFSYQWCFGWAKTKYSRELLFKPDGPDRRYRESVCVRESFPILFHVALCLVRPLSTFLTPSRMPLSVANM